MLISRQRTGGARQACLVLILFLLVSCASGTSLPQKFVLVAHRGASHLAPENTLASFALAWPLGADLIEGDFYLTTDGVVVTHHDATTKRTAGVDLRVESQTLADLKALDVGTWKDPKWAGERIPTLEEVLDSVADNKKILIEIKSDARIMVPLVAVIESSDLSPDQMVVICFNEDVLELAKKSMPHIKTLWLSSFEQGDDGKWTPTAEEIIATAMRINADGVHLKAIPEVIDRVFVAKLRHADLEFHVWTVDDPELARTMLRLGADSITTNRPGWLREQLRNRTRR